MNPPNNGMMNSIIEAYAKQTGLTREVAEVKITEFFSDKNNNNGNGTQNHMLPIPVVDPDSQGLEFLKALNEAKENMKTIEKSTTGIVTDTDPDFRGIRKMMIEMMMMERMLAPKTPVQQENRPAIDTESIIAKNNEMWQRRFEQEKAERDREKAEQKMHDMENKLDRLERLLSKSVEQANNNTSKSDPIMDEIKETRKELAIERDKRQQDILQAKDRELKEFKTYMEDRVRSLELRDPPKSTDAVLIEEADRMNRFEKLMNQYGTSHGWTQEKIDKEVEDGKPAWLAIIADAVKENGIISKLISAQQAAHQQPIQPEIVVPSSQNIACKNCNSVSTNGTDICDLCRNDMARNQELHALAQEQAARRNGEIPLEVQQQSGIEGQGQAV